MSCPHKNIRDLDLSYADYEVRTLIIGTFNPGWTCVRNYSEWFYGRTQRNEFWCILPKLYNEPSLLNGNRETWIDFCSRHNIGITDIIHTILDADPALHQDIICNSGFSDKEFELFQDFKLTNITDLLDRHPTIEKICITRKNLSGFWEGKFGPVRITCQKRGIKFVPLRSPSRAARKGVIGNFCTYVANDWLANGF